MIHTLKDLLINSHIAVVGSSPTAKLFKNDCDYSIAVNGAALLERRFDIFMCGDVNSPQREWFYSANCTRRVIAKIISMQDIILYPDLQDRPVFRAEHQHRIPKLADPKSPHLTYIYRAFRPEKVLEKPDFLMYGGTISCCAVQLAYLIGAKTITLYGCEFTKNKTDHYFYKGEHIGCIRNSMRNIMNKVLQELRSVGVRIEVVGDTTLSSYDKKYAN